ncbi:DNA-formamidopyrimidine glycosylase [Candidatus Daviesbacteria bacterium RIFCSPHIGHO2_01_FULL_40_11]|uniref:DNA-formamidopyrimidine glycosylase n=1 Tax=Candidatus Daviesbacteria bacterium RIFCSPHIGHO2_01_FULL_40_11 TaxID=1797762 RepID=A0A1F5JHH6_9BACT|nr:MAG: DNA-formamidopyrimidine glycosylase [Candidatus Daviesbacteria bacterium RIFCSPHIGHO2_01_FULL_40_11]
MPELPEVEVIRLGLSRKIIGLKIQKIQVLSPKSFLGNPNLVQGQKVLNIWRKAKILGVELSGDKTLLFHLKMSGQLVWKGESGKGEGERFIGGHPTIDMVGQMPNSHTRVIFSFAGGSHLYFNDQRKFGWVKVVQSAKLKVQSEGILGKLGPEPLDKGFAWQVLKQNLLKHKNMPVKVAIMDQSVVSGVGNIYANEACFDARLDPRTKVGSLTDEQFTRLHHGIVKSLQDGIKHGGSTRAHFVDAEGHKGYFLDYAFVYWRDKHACKVCGTEIKKVTLGGRGTYLCPKCQKAV